MHYVGTTAGSCQCRDFTSDASLNYGGLDFGYTSTVGIALVGNVCCKSEIGLCLKQTSGSEDGSCP